MSQIEILENIVDICSKQHLESVFTTELGVYGLKTYVSPDKTFVFSNDEGMSKVLDFAQVISLF